MTLTKRQSRSYSSSGRTHPQGQSPRLTFANIFSDGGSSSGNKENRPHNVEPFLIDTQPDPSSATAPLTESSSPVVTGGSPKLDEEVLRALGAKTKAQIQELRLHPDLTELLNDWLTEDHDKDMNEELSPKYSRTVEQCQIEAPKLNPELVATSSEQIVKRDNNFITSQNITGSALVSLAMALNTLLTAETDVDRFSPIEKLSDTAKLLAQLHRSFSYARRAFISPTVNKDCRATMYKAKPYVFLYGEKLSDEIRSAKSIVKLGQDFKTKPTPKPPTKTLNWKSPLAHQSKQLQVGEKSTSSPRIHFRQNYRGSRHQSSSYQNNSNRPHARQQTRNQSSYQPTSHKKR